MNEVEMMLVEKTDAVDDAFQLARRRAVIYIFQVNRACTFAAGVPINPINSTMITRIEEVERSSAPNARRSRILKVLLARQGVHHPEENTFRVGLDGTIEVLFGVGVYLGGQ